MSNNISSTTTNKNVVDTAAANGSFKVFGKALRQAGMADTLKGTGRSRCSPRPMRHSTSCRPASSTP